MSLPKLVTRALLSTAIASFTLATACEPGTPTEPGTHPDSGRLGISADGQTLYVALPDHDLVRAVDADSGAVVGETSVAGHPHRLTVLSDGRIAVSARYANRVNVLSENAGQVLSSVAVGSDPFGLVESDGHIVVALSGENMLARIPLDDTEVVADRVALDYREPRGLARAADGTLFVTHFHAGVVSAVNPEVGVAEEGIRMHLVENPFFQPNQMDSLTVAPDGSEVAIPHEECNNDPAQFGAGGGGLAGSFPQYYVEGPTGFPAVVPAVSRFDASARLNLSRGPGDIAAEQPSSLFEREDVPAASPAPAVINPLDTDLLGDDLVNAPVAVALADGGRLELVVNRGSGNVLLRRTSVRAGERSIFALVELEPGISDIVLSPDGATAYVLNELEHTVHAFAVPALARAADGSSVFSGRQDTTLDGLDGSLPRIQPTRVLTVAEEVLPAEVALGRRLFTTVDERMTRRGAIACASCHPGGGDDAITWNFAEGPRQTPALWGGISDTAPFHWDQAVTTIEVLNDVTIRGRMGGTGLTDSDVRAIGAFLDTIPAPSPPTRADGASVDRGAEIFYSEAAGCTGCHAGSDYTDGLAHNVGTGPGFVERESQTSFATPVLHGLAHTAPYMHDGSAGTLHDVVESYVRTDRMGTGSHLSDDDVDDLVAFLSTL